MDVRFVTRNVELVDSIKDHMEKKLGKLDRFFDRILDTQVSVDFKRGMYVVEITSNVNGMVMRGEDYAPDLRKDLSHSQIIHDDRYRQRFEEVKDSLRALILSHPRFGSEDYLKTWAEPKRARPAPVRRRQRP